METLLIEQIKEEVELLPSTVEKIDFLNTRAWEIRYSNPSLLLELSTHARELSEKVSYKGGMARSWRNTGVAYALLSQHQRAVQGLENALKLYQELGDQDGQIAVIANLGATYQTIGQFETALSWHFKALSLAEARNLNDVVANTLGNIAALHFSLEQYDTALYYHHRALELRLKVGDLHGISDSYGGIGSVLQRTGNYTEALGYLHKALEYAEASGDESAIALAHTYIGITQRSMGEQGPALLSFVRALNLYDDIANQRSIAETLLELSHLHRDMGSLHEAIEHAGRALEIALEYGVRDLESQIYEGLSQIYEKAGDSDNALKFYRKFAESRYEVVSTISKRHLQQVQELYESEKENRQQEITAAQQQIELLSQAIQSMNDAVAISDGTGRLIYVNPAFCQLFQFSTEEVLGQSIRLVQSAQTDEELLRAIVRGTRAGGWDGELTCRRKDGADFPARMTSSVVYNDKQEVRAYVAIFRDQSDYRQTNASLATALAELEQTARQLNERNDDITSSIHYARRIQEAILPSKAEAQDLFPQSFIYYKPKDIVCGDFFWVARGDDNMLYAAAVDCTGHGVPAALMSIIGHNLLTEVVMKDKVREPGKILTQLHQRVRQSLKQDHELKQGDTYDGMDICLCAIDTVRSEIQYAGAFNSLYIAKRGVVEEVHADKIPIGGYQDEAFRIYTNHRIAYQGGEVLYLSTDGFANQLSSQQKRYSTKRFKDFLTGLRAAEMPEQEAMFETEYQAWADGYEQMDDILVMGIRL